MKRILVALCAFVHLTILSEQTLAQGSVGLQKEALSKMLIVPQRFFISSIIDERTGLDSTGSVLFSADDISVTHGISLESATLPGIKKSIAGVIARDTLLRPVIIRIKEYNIREVLSDPDLVNGELNVSFMFELDKKSGSVPLTQYKDTTKYTRSLSNLSTVEPALKTALVNSLKFINNWFSVGLRVEN